MNAPQALHTRACSFSINAIALDRLDMDRYDKDIDKDSVPHVYSHRLLTRYDPRGIDRPLPRSNCSRERTKSRQEHSELALPMSSLASFLRFMCELFRIH